MELRPLATGCTPASLERLAHEYHLKEALSGDWAVRPLELVSEGSQTVLVLEDSGAAPLDRLIGTPLRLERFLQLAIEIVTALGKVHQRGLIHKDIKPAHILVNDATGEVRLTGFGIASRLPRERQSPEHPELIAGTLAYMAPEQTGRMNRSIDSRSDLYALGVTLYEMLTGTLPFTALDPLEWVHCHIARQPAAPDERVSGIPAPLSAIVMKLLSKPAEDRYQTAGGLEWDLRKCLTEWEAAHRIDPFPLGTHDTTRQLLIPEKLYGRRSEIATLLDAFERVATQGTRDMVLVSGYSGIGKSSVVNELHKVIVLPRGIFISGKFDLRLRDIPYSTLAQAFAEQIRQILNGQDAEIARWRQVIEEAVGQHGRLLTDLIPELANLIGPQPAVPVLSPLETQLRFQAVFQKFVGVFARAEHPLVIFLDDLQWLDPATLTVVEYLITHADTHHLLLIGAYRDNEVAPGHPLMDMLGSIREAGTMVHEIVLGPLSPEDFGELLCDAFRCTHEQALPLARLVHQKTDGNPFFAGQLLTNLVEEGLLEFEPDSASWRWNLEHIDAKGFTDNVVELMVRRLQRLSPRAQDAVKLLACLGSQADFSTLASVWGDSEASVHADFSDAVRAGAIVSMDRSFKFLHDRVQEAAYALIPAESRAEHHLRIGRLLLSKLDEADIATRIFDLVNQLNHGSELMVERPERHRAATLNLDAAKKAKASTAYRSACNYLAAAASLLSQQGWDDCYELTFRVWFERAECEFLLSQFGEATRWIDDILLRARSKIHRAEAYRLRMVLQLVNADNASAVRTARECLEVFAIDLPDHPTDDEVSAEYDAVFAHLGARPIESLLELPMMEDLEMREVMQIFHMLGQTAYFTDMNLAQTIACRMVVVTLEYGTTESAVIAYAFISILLGPFFHRYQDGEAFARLAVAVAEKHGFVAQQVAAHFFMQMAVLWTQPIEVALGCVDTARRYAQETGEVIYASFSLEHRLTDLLARGYRLDEAWLDSINAIEFVKRIHFRHVHDILSSIQHFIQRLRGRTSDETPIEDATIDAQITEGGIAVVNCFHWILQVQRHYLLGEPEKALACAAKASPLLWSTRCHIQFANYCLYHSLALAAVHNSASADRQAEIKADITANIEAFARWAKNCPITFAHKHLLLRAELARLNGHDMQAMRFYEHAARSAGEQGFVQDQALVNELAAQCCLAAGLERAAHAYLREARNAYSQWGAHGKIEQLDRLYPLSKPEAASVPRVTIEELGEQLDLATIVKTAQAISGEMVLENLIKSLMTTAIEHAGAERGLLILRQGALQRVEAEATIQGSRVIVQLPQQSPNSLGLPDSLLRYVASTHEPVIIDDASVENRFSGDPYIRQKCARSVLCLPLLKQAGLIGMLYLENNLAPGVFAPKRIALLKLLASQAAIALENARLYRDLAEREAKIRRLVDSNIVGILIADLEGRILEANDAFLRMLGYGRDDLLVGRLSWRDLTPSEWIERTNTEWEKLEKTGILQPYEKEYFRKDGSRVPVLIGIAMLGENATQAIGFVLDLSELKRAEADARQMQLELAHANRVTAIGQLAASISHEMKQPIAATTVNASTGLRCLGLDPPEVEEARRAFDRIVRDARRAGEVIKRIHGLVIKAPMSNEILQINEAIREVMALTSSEATRNGVSLRLRLAEDLPAIKGDRVQIQQVILNLIINAIDAMSAVDKGPRELTIDTAMIEPGVVLVAVRDSGPGIAPENIERLFEPFYTTKASGMGMGLPICHSIVEAHGGRLWAGNDAGRGAIFQFTLPINPAVSAAVSA
ncbi:AAA family ATPase [Paraburkholderia sp. CNPSo 3272]|uniref:trifunctional serine/threonine-protein kinase/ATP-binding protein/sensor histidine kinase n=1 Tax=Paraburkholderia sp. CNPSo 3272 TaxID=2940931 RepID=UPI0020B7BB4F|nr:ATP-binding sensor histidine kinase [Paraburkholderia sp. CNPSo 3272]MCP3728488.1 AAA family ATPase [Paraburkholderia sp. CNPSo 3272]